MYEWSIIDASIYTWAMNFNMPTRVFRIWLQHALHRYRILEAISRNTLLIRSISMCRQWACHLTNISHSLTIRFKNLIHDFSCNLLIFKSKESMSEENAKRGSITIYCMYVWMIDKFIVSSNVCPYECIIDVFIFRK
jgi:hypothetical protein